MELLSVAHLAGKSVRKKVEMMALCLAEHLADYLVGRSAGKMDSRTVERSVERTALLRVAKKVGWRESA
jgi:hypothetical protein